MGVSCWLGFLAWSTLTGMIQEQVLSMLRFKFFPEDNCIFQEKLI